MAVDMVKARQLREQGMTFKEIAQEVNCSEGHLRTVLKGMAKGVRYEEKSVEDELKRISKELSSVVKRMENSQE